MKFTVVTILPELVEPALAAGVVGRAREAGVISLDTVNPRDFTTDRHRTVDDTPYGGGPGMVMKPEPLLAAIAKAATPSSRRILLTPAGAPLTQARVKELAKLEHLVLVCGRYEGIDERVIELAIDEEISIGDYVLSGGELGALVIIDAVARLVPGVLGEPTSADDESHSAGLLEYPQYTRPLKLVAPPTSGAVAASEAATSTNEAAASTSDGARMLEVPAILTSGNHAAIASWRRQQALLRTARRRPELFVQHALTPADRKLLPPPLASRTHLALVHHPCVDRTGKIVTTSLTNFDIHDLARSTATYGLAAYHIVTPITSQREKADHIASLWLEENATRKPPSTGSRAGALSRVRTADSVETVIAELTADYKQAPIVVGTSARAESFPGVPRRSPTELVAEAVTEPAPLLILLGTGWGLADHLIPSVSRVLAPIEGGSDWNHLSVRSAGAILLDRMFDRSAVTRRVGPA
ncbi:MAG TPA: tRNA (guanosine(37)-N1)-methyltransferase TrmD [Kofleriaceae bacterium]|jgi:tRNA (guanine37-N1)-methyltransferase|nr:tRNA (guanosine(37)-N1)-methyltransferase TrmD [Kofleriaceae bacterium]